eukprot:TRINITY_DN12517_c0_g5_i1.p2 TRINITY_DN12517_c0_g5~~TRINITY_DN12517_c0_g5_i1.p2  ORF type:complete len:537 (+),score=254.86 TRINITY_DN12517_c0_g5_i1:101-1711(+)
MSSEAKTLRRGMSVNLKKNVIACQPFKDGVSTIICSGCHALMAYPAKSEKVRCSACSTVTTGIKVPCTSCKKPLRLPIKLEDAVCGNCGYHFQPISTFRLALPAGKEVKTVNAVVMDDTKPEAKKKEKPKKVAPPPKEKTFINLVLKTTGNVQVEAKVKCQIDRILDTNFVGWASKLELEDITSLQVTKESGEELKTDKTPKKLALKDNDVLMITPIRDAEESGNHVFKPKQFLKPTSCAYCRKFIWGVYKQGQICKKCHIPVHHRCAKKVTVYCETAFREACGLCMEDMDPDAINNEEDIPDGFPIDAEDMEDWQVMKRDAADTEYRKESYLSNFGKLSDWTDEEIADIWKKYDTNDDGELDREEVTQLIGDMMGTMGGGFKDGELEKEMDRIMARMDANGNGVVEWEEFWYFCQARKATDFLEKFQGCSLTEEQAKEIWDKYDEDESGTLDNDEIQAMLCDLASTAGIGIQDLTSNATGFWELGQLVTWEKFKEVFLPILSGALEFEEEEEQEWDEDWEEEFEEYEEEEAVGTA